MTEQVAPQSPEINYPKESADILVLMDVDRNLIKTEVLSEIIVEKLDTNGISSDEIEEIRRQVQESGGSFDYFATLRDEKHGYSQEVIDKVYSEVVQEAAVRKDLSYDDPDCLFYEGVRELVDQKREDGVARVFVTRGGEENQMMKLRDILGVDVSKEMYSILPLTGEDSKAKMSVQAYDSARGKFVFRWFHNGPEAGFVASSIVVIDDKAKELLELAKLGRDKAIGFWHRTPGGVKSQELPDGVDKPDNVYEINSLAEIGRFGRAIGNIALGSDTDWTTR